MKNLKKTSLLTGSIVAGALFASASVTAGTNLDFNFLGTGSQLRTRLLSDAGALNLIPAAQNTLKTIEGTCGDKKSETSSSEAKTKDAKCGEGKCGDSKKDAKKAKKTNKKSEAKAKEGKCGEGKCGDSKKADSKTN